MNRNLINLFFCIVNAALVGVWIQLLADALKSGNGSIAVPIFFILFNGFCSALCGSKLLNSR